MTTSQALRLVRGDKYIDLSSSPYAINEFTPPPMALTPTVATGSSANRTGGGKLVATSYNDRSLSFSVRVLGTTATQIRNAINAIVNLLAGYNEDQSVKMYIEYAPISDTPEPLWGTYGARLHYEIVYGTASVWDNYSNGPLRAEGALVYVSCEIKPFAETNQLQLCTATGGINEDRLGSLKGVSRGLLVPEATTNKHTNPVFGNSTYDTNWTTGASLIKSQITTNPLLGYSSVQLTAAAAANNTFYEAITLTATTYTLSYYVTLPDLSTPSSTQLQVVYDGAAQSSTYYQIEGGLYLVWASVTGTAAAHNCGIVVKNGYTVILHAAQCEAKAYPTPLAYGDMMGCAWSSTAHASASTRTAASCKLPITDAVIKAGEGSVRMIVRFDVANTFSRDMYFCDLRDAGHTSAPYLVYDSGSDIFSLVHSGGTATSSGALTFSASTNYVIHATWGAGTATLYVNGSQVDSDAYTSSTLGANMWIGTTYVTSAPPIGALSLATFGTALTSTQVANDYASLLPALTQNTAIDPIPFFWTTSGDNILGLDTGKLPFGVAAGIPGSIDALTEIRATASSDFSTVGYLLLNCFKTKITIPSYLLILDSQGSAAAGDYGGQHRNTAAVDSGSKWQVSTSTSGGAGVTKPFAIELDNRQSTYLARLKAASATSLNIFASCIMASAYSDAKLITTNTSYRCVRTNPIILDLYKGSYTGMSIGSVVFGGVYATTLTGTLSVDVDWTGVLFDDVLIVQAVGGTVAVIRGNETRYATATTIYNLINKIGNEIKFAPNKYNHLQAYLGVDSAVDPLTTYTTTIGTIYVTPRWALL